MALHNRVSLLITQLCLSMHWRMVHRICASLLCTLRVPHRIVSHCSLSSYVFQNLFPVYSHAFILGIPCAPFATLGLGLRAQRLTCISSRTLLHIPCPQSSARALSKKDKFQNSFGLKPLEITRMDSHCSPSLYSFQIIPPVCLWVMIFRSPCNPLAALGPPCI
jgi:hypothetical protein